MQNCIQWQAKRPACDAARTLAARSKRKLEFARGRSIAQLLLGRFGELKNVGVAADRSPIWPPGFIGSISHSDDFVWVAIGRQSAAVSVGIDTEPIVSNATRVQLQAEIATDKEWLIASRLNLDPLTTFTILFSAKEAFYKCCYPLTHLFFSFQDVAIEAANNNRVRLRMRPSNPNLSSPSAAALNTTKVPSTLDVFFRVHEGNVFTVAWIDQPNTFVGELR